MHTEAELKAILDNMRDISGRFYASAVHVGNHPFIEFCGLMNEYIECCRDAMKDGIDFTDCNTHTGRPLPINSIRMKYLNEKLECIFNGAIVLKAKPGTTAFDEDDPAEPAAPARVAAN